MPEITMIRLSGLLAMLGALLYAVGDTFLLAARVNLAGHPNLQPHTTLLSGAEKMAMIPWTKLAWGALLGVFATPLILAGHWQVYHGLTPAGLPVFLLFLSSSVVGAFVHGSFYYLGEYVQALDRLSGDEAQSVITGMLTRHRKILVVTYGFVGISLIAATLWYIVLIVMGRTAFPRWMAAINPLTGLAAWLVLKRLLPSGVAAAFEGAGFSIAYLFFFTATTLVLWEGI